MMSRTMSLENLARNLSLRKSGSSYHGACPVCGYKTGFQLTKGHGDVLVGYCHAGRCDMTDFFRGLYSGQAISTRSGTLKSIEIPDHEKIQTYPNDMAAENLWCASLPADGTIVETYLRSRGLTCLIPEAIRFIPEHKHKETGKKFPLMLARVDKIGEEGPVAVHRTFLKKDGSGKADVTPNKKSLGQLSQGGVFLSNPGMYIAISEGIETGLTFQQATGIPTIAALSTSGMEGLILSALPLAQKVFIIADNDPPGLNAAVNVARRLEAEGRNVHIAMPPESGEDFNDLLMRSLQERKKK